MSFIKRSNSIFGLNDRDKLTRIRIINSFKLNEEAFLKKYFCDRDSLFNICLPSFNKLIKEKADIKFISLYLANLTKFITLLKNANEDNTNNPNQKQNITQKDKYLKLLKYVSEHVSLETFLSKRLVMRFGELGSKFYIILHGVISILIPVKVNLQMTFFEFSKYIANLLLYKEFELARITMRENKHVYRIDLPEMKYIINFFNKFSEEDEDNFKIQNNEFNILKGARSEKNFHTTKLIHKMKIFKVNNNVDNQDDKNMEEDKELEAEHAQKIKEFMKLFLSKEQYKLFEEVKTQKEEIEKDNGIELSVDTYINRLKIYKSDLEITPKIKKKQESVVKKLQITHRQVRSKTSKINIDKESFADDKEKIYLNKNKNKNTVYIYEYQEIIQLETGDMFGDTALGTAAAKRTATIITATDCHFGSLNKEAFNFIKFSSDKKRKNNINYICRIRIFRNLTFKIIEEKYINYFVFKNCTKDECLIRYGEINNNIIIIKSGKFEINIKGDIKYIFELINEYKNIFINLEESELRGNLIGKITKINSNRKKIEKLFEANHIKSIDESLNKLFVINSSSFFGFKENEKRENNNYISFFEIKCVSAEGEYILLDKRIFYRQIYSTDYKLKEDTHIYIKEFIEKTINRLVHILYSKIYYLLSCNDMKILKRMKLLSGIQDNNKNDSNEIKNLMDEIELDQEFMNKYDLTDIEYIIDMIFNKYNEEDFDDEYSKIRLYNENKIITGNNKNKIKLGEEKYNINKTNVIFKHLGNINKLKLNKLSNFKKYNNLKLKKSWKLPNSDKIQQSFIFYNDKKNNRFRDIKYNKIKNNSFDEEKKQSFISENTIKNTRNFTFILNKNNNTNNMSTYNLNNNNIDKSISLCGLGRASDSFIQDINISCNYANYGNACISKLSFNFMKDVSMSIFENSKLYKTIKKVKPLNVKMDKIYEKYGNFRPKFERCFSVKHRDLSSINFNKTHQVNKKVYSERRKKYLLKSVRNIFTRNKPIVLYKRKNKCDKKV